jgi:hypothetical protein
MAIDRPAWLPDDADTERPSIARMYDYFLGGTRHVEKDREVAREAHRAAPGIKILILENRKFLQRVARLAAESGISQFLDIGSGILARGNVHEVVHAVNPDGRVAYVDIDPVAVTRGRELLAGDPRTVSVRGDLTEPGDILGDPEIRGLLDFSRPVALLLLNVLHFVPRQSVTPAVAAYRAALAPGSLLSVTHGTADTLGGVPPAIAEVYGRAFGQMEMRTAAEVAGLFGDFELVEPGIVDLPQWQPGATALKPSRAGLVHCYGAAAFKPRDTGSSAA